MIVPPAQGGNGTQIRLPLHEHKPMNTSPFNLHEPAAYKAWRERKLADYPIGSEDLLVRLSDSLPFPRCTTRKSNSKETSIPYHLLLYTSQGFDL